MGPGAPDGATRSLSAAAQGGFQQEGDQIAQRSALLVAAGLQALMGQEGQGDRDPTAAALVRWQQRERIRAAAGGGGRLVGREQPGDQQTSAELNQGVRTRATASSAAAGRALACP